MSFQTNNNVVWIPRASPFALRRTSVKGAGKRETDKNCADPVKRQMKRWLVATTYLALAQVGRKQGERPARKARDGRERYYCGSPNVALTEYLAIS